MENALRKVRERTSLTRALKIFSHGVSALAVAAFLYLTFVAVKASAYELIKLLVTLGVPFVILSVVRRVINAPRPYELYDFYDIPPKNKRGSSFPSRHAHSAVAIGTVLCFYSPILGGVLLLLGCLMCCARVLLGMHFIRDVLAGAVTGAASSLLGALIFSLT